MMKRYRLDPAKPPKLTAEQALRLDNIKIDYSEIPELGDEFFTKTSVAWPPAKQQLTIRLDSDVISWLKENGRGYQTRINHILRAAMDGQTARKTAAKAKLTKKRR